MARTLFTPPPCQAIAKLGFVQADRIRAPARAQDLTLRHRVKELPGRRPGRRYAKLDIEEDFFVNYGFLPRATQALMHPRTPRHHTASGKSRWTPCSTLCRPTAWSTHAWWTRTLRTAGHRTGLAVPAMPARSCWTTCTTRGLLRIASRASGVRTYAVRDTARDAADPALAMDALIDVIVNKYAPLPERSLSELVSHLRGGAPQWAHLRRDALVRAKARLAHATVDGLTYYWPAHENPASRRYTTRKPDEAMHLLAPFDPLVWDRRRFEHLWRWVYRFEGLTPLPPNACVATTPFHCCGMTK